MMDFLRSGKCKGGRKVSENPEECYSMTGSYLGEQDDTKVVLE